MRIRPRQSSPFQHGKYVVVEESPSYYIVDADVDLLCLKKSNWEPIVADNKWLHTISTLPFQPIGEEVRQKIDELTVMVSRIVRKLGENQNG